MSEPAPPDDRELRDELVAHYQSYTRGRGADVPARQLEQLAIADLNLADRVEAEAKPAAPGAAADLAPPPDEPCPAAVLADNRGYEYVKRAIPTPGPTRARPRLLEKPRALARRMAQMCQTAPGAKGTSLADRNYLYPAFAKDVITEHTDFTFRRRRYRGLDAKDRQRAFWRAIEDIADRSTGVLGPWWVK